MGEEVLVRYLSDSLRLVEGVMRKNAQGGMVRRELWL